MIGITSRDSGFSPGSPTHTLDYQEPYLRTVFNLAGIEGISFINAQPLEFTPGITSPKLQEAKESETIGASLRFGSGRCLIKHWLWCRVVSAVGCYPSK